MKPDISVHLRPALGHVIGVVENPELKRFVEGKSQIPASFTEELMGLCKIDVPLLKFLPRAAASPFSGAWARLFTDAGVTGSLASWKACFMFPKAVLLAPVRAGRRVSQKKGSLATQVLEKIQRFSSDRDSLWSEVLERATNRVPRARESKSESGGKVDGKVIDAVKKSVESRIAKCMEKAAVAALRIGDVHKALRILNDAPLAPKNEATLIELRKLHPQGSPPVPPPSTKLHRFPRS